MSVRPPARDQLFEDPPEPPQVDRDFAAGYLHTMCDYPEAEIAEHSTEWVRRRFREEVER
jgi:hypothetical protein